MMLSYKGVQVNLAEGMNFKDGDFTVTAKDRFVYRASSDYGVTYALDGQQAFEDMKRLIDRNVP